MMLFEEFEQEVKEELLNRLHDVKLLSDVITKNNGIKLHALSITPVDAKIGVYVYLDSLYSRYVKCERSIPEIADLIVEQYEAGIKNFALDVSTINDYEQAKHLIRGRLINTEQNVELMSSIPHREFLDLTIIYCLDIKETDGNGIGSIRISNALMEQWDANEDMLYQQMMQNMERAEEGKVVSIESILGEILETMLENAKTPFPMYVITNYQKANGAIEILNKNILEKAAVMLGEDFWIIPSSVHEWILLPMRNKQEDKEYIRSMVREINDTQVAEEEILSYEIYCYHQETGEIEIAA